jgi:PLP dependent protein
MTISDNLNKIKKNLPSGCKLIAVSKTHPPEVIEEAYRAGHKIFGENKVQEMQAKAEVLPRDIEWHLIGHLQTNKVKYIAPFVACIHSVDSLKLLQEINKQAAKANRIIPCLLQIHIAKEETKFGLSEQEAFDLILGEEIKSLNNIIITGVMGMATFTENRDQIRSEFKELKQLFDSLSSSKVPANVKMTEISMGMSGDYDIAIEEGSTMIRVGSAIFGHRNYNRTNG